MNISRVDNYQHSLDYQAQCQQAASNYRLAGHGSRLKSATIGVHRVFQRLVLAITLIAGVLVLLSSARPALANDAPQFEPGDGNLFHDAMVAFTMGRYYYATEDYHKALDYFGQCLDLLPEVAFEVAPQDYANIYRMLGKTQAALGNGAEAHISFERYLTLAGDGADPIIVATMSEVADGDSSIYAVGPMTSPPSRIIG